MPADGAALALTPVALPRMAPDLALRAYQQLAAQQEMELSSYFSTTIIRARLPDASQYGEYELCQHYAAPRTLEFKAVHFIGEVLSRTTSSLECCSPKRIMCRKMTAH